MSEPLESDTPEESNLKVLVGRLIRKRRKENNLTQQELANMLRVDRQYISKIEKGKINLTLDYLEKIISKLDCSGEDFLQS